MGSGTDVKMSDPVRDFSEKRVEINIAKLTQVQGVEKPKLQEKKQGYKAELKFPFSDQEHGAL